MHGREGLGGEGVLKKDLEVDKNGRCGKKDWKV